MSDTSRKVLEILAGGQFISGAAIGDQLGISRTAVWKHLKQLEAWGIVITKARGCGYRIDGGIELLSRQRILHSLSDTPRSLVKQLAVLDHVDSTNSVARQQLINGNGGPGYICLAERQTLGRGRLGRSWVSPFGRNIYFSATWEFQGGVAELEGLSLAVGVAVCHAIRSFDVDAVALKWPNDVLLHGRKVGGILLEMIGDPVGPCQVIVGIGLNLAMPGNVTIDQPWADLADYPAVTRNGLAGAVISELLPLLSTYADLGFRHYKPQWETCDAYNGKQVQLTVPGKTMPGKTMPGKIITGISRGVATNGAICLEIDGTRHFFNGGEISLRRYS
jgi:BirA family transcriptional regulator, biotin operon repressor / biotin---[acetyl-CoA-carboxylase] ligase